MFKHSNSYSSSSWIRIRLLQRLLQKKESDYEGILCIPGIDSFYDTAPLSCSDYCLPNFRAIEYKSQKTEDDEDTLEDVMFLIDKMGVSFYCNPMTYPKILNEVVGYSRCKLISLDEEKFQSSDHADDYKIRCLVQFTDGFANLAIPFTDSSNSSKDKVLPIEKWPLIQAFAAEDYGKRGFFTLKHKVTNVTKTLRMLSAEFMDFNNIGTAVLKKLLPAYSLQWNNTTSAICAVADNVSLLEKIRLAETFESYVEHSFATNDLDEANVASFAVAAPANDFCLPMAMKMIRPDKKSERECYKFRSMFENQGAIICFLRSPAPPSVTTGRTYFVQTSAGDGQGDLKSFERNVYKCLVEAADYSVQEFVSMGRQSSVEKAEKIFLKTLNSKLAESLTAKLTFQHVFTIENTTNHELFDGLEFPRLKFVLAAIFVESPSNEKFGLLFADTFLPVCISSCDGGVFSSQVFWLTNGIPRYLNLRNLEIQRMIANTVYRNSREEGCVTLLGTQSAMTAFLPKHSALFPDSMAVQTFKISLNSLNMTMELANGLSINLDGALDVIKINCFEQSTPPADYEAMFIEIHFSIRNRNNATFPFKADADSSGDEDVLLICLQSKTVPYRDFYHLILPSWGLKKAQDGATASPEKIAHLSSETKYINKFSSIVGTQIKHAVQSSAATLPVNFLNVNSSAILVAETQCATAQQFLPPKRELDSMFSGVSITDIISTAASDFSGKINIHLISGMPECGIDQVAKTLMSKKTRDDLVWLGVFGLFPSNAMAGAYVINFKEDHFQVETAFRQFLTEKLSPHESVHDFKGQVMILCPFFVDIPSFIAFLERTFDGKFQNNAAKFQLVFKSAILFLDGFSDVTLANRSINPIVQDHLKPGILSAVVAYSTPGRNRDAVRGQNFDLVRRTVRALNPSVAIFRNPSDVDIEQLPEFWSRDLCALRCRFWTDLERIHFINAEPLPKELGFIRSSQAVTLVFKQRVLQKDKLAAHLYMLAKHVNGPSLFHFEEDPAADSGKAESLNWCVWHVAGEIGFADSDDVVRLTFTLPQQIFRTIPLHKKQSSFFLTFYGENISEQTMKDWLRLSAHTRPAQKPLLRIEDLAPAFWGKLQGEHHLDPLPEGWYFNGTYYLDGNGEKAYRHPRLNEIAADYVANYNQQIERGNNEARKQSFPDLFD